MEKKRMTVAQAHRLLGTTTNKELADLLGAKYQNIQYWRRKGMPRWWATAVRARVSGGNQRA